MDNLELKITGIIDKLNDLELTLIKQWRILDHLERMIKDAQGHDIANI